MAERRNVAPERVEADQGFFGVSGEEEGIDERDQEKKSGQGEADFGDEKFTGKASVGEDGVGARPERGEGDFVVCVHFGIGRSFGRSCWMDGSRQDTGPWLDCGVRSRRRLRKDNQGTSDRGNRAEARVGGHPALA